MPYYPVDDTTTGGETTRRVSKHYNNRSKNNSSNILISARRSAEKHRRSSNNDINNKGSNDYHQNQANYYANNYDNDNADYEPIRLHVNQYQRRDSKQVTPFSTNLQNRSGGSGGGGSGMNNNATNLESSNYYYADITPSTSSSPASFLNSLTAGIFSSLRSLSGGGIGGGGGGGDSPGPNATTSPRTPNNTYYDDIDIATALMNADIESSLTNGDGNENSFSMSVGSLLDDVGTSTSMNMNDMSTTTSLLFNSTELNEENLPQPLEFPPTEAGAVAATTAGTNNETGATPKNETTPLLLNTGRKPAIDVGISVSVSAPAAVVAPPSTKQYGSSSSFYDNAILSAAIDVANNITKMEYGQQQQQQHQQQSIQSIPHRPPAKQDTAVQSTNIHNLTVKERQVGTCDLYGMSELIQENPLKIKQLLNDMDKYIISVYCHSQTNSNKSAALGWAYLNHFQYIQDEKIKFLRAKNYDPKQAVKAMAVYYTKKKSYFGIENLGIDITMSMFTENEICYLKQGGIQMMAGGTRDKFGRTISIQFGKIWECIPIDSSIRIMMYGSQILTKDVRIQLNGYVHVLIAHSMKSNLSSRHELLKAKEMMVCRSSLPLKCVGKHFCYNNMSIVNSLYNVFVHVLNPFQAVRVRFHYGTIQECIYNLMEYGISHNDIPIQYRTTNNSIGEGVITTLDDDEFHIDTQFHIAFLEAIEEREEVDRLQQQQQSQQQQQQQSKQQPQSQSQSQYSQQQSSQTEAQQQGMTNALDRNENNGRGNRGGGSTNNFNKNNNNSGGSIDGGITNNNNATRCVVIVPGPLDIIMGRGCHNTNKPGNVRLKNLLETYRSQYDSTNSKNEKNAIVQTILQQVTDSASRFLIQDTTATTKTSSSSSNSSTSGSKNNNGNGNGNGKDGRWIISSHQKAYDKIAHDLRNMRRRRAVAAAAAATTITNTNN